MWRTRTAGSAPAAPAARNWMLPYNMVVELYASTHPAVEVPASSLVELAGRGVKEQRVVRRVELDVGRTKPHQLLDLIAQDLRHVIEEIVEGGVDLSGELRRPEVGIEAGARER